MEPLTGPLASHAWQRLNLESLLTAAAGTLEGRQPGEELTPAARDLLAQLPAVTRTAADTLRDPARYRSPWAAAGPRTADRGGERQLTVPQYFFTDDGTLAMLVCRPEKAGESFTPAKEANDAMRAVLAEAGPSFPGVSLGLTGV